MTAGETTATERRAARPGARVDASRRVFWIGFAFAALMSVLWALASPIFSVPDENAHVLKAVAQVRGQFFGESAEGRKHPVVDLPEGYDYNDGMMCHVDEPQHSADCGIEFGDGTGQSVGETWVSSYNPIYYAMVGWPSLLTDDAVLAVYAMRVLSALLCSVLLGWAFQLAVAGRRTRWMPLGAAFLVLPMVVYLAGSVNPNGVEIAAGAALWLGGLRLLESHADGGVPASRPRWYLWLVVTVAAVLLANARAIGPLWVLVIAVACAAVVGWRAAGRMFATRGSYPWIGAIAAASVFSFAWTLATGGVAGQAGESDAVLVGVSPIVGFLAMLRRTGQWAQHSLGDFGWLDTPLPPEMYALVLVPLSLFVLLAVTGTDRRGLLVNVGAAVLVVLVPAIVQGLQISRTGLIWQGRYGLVLFLAIPLAAAWALSRPAGHRLAFLSQRITWVGAAMLAVYSAFAYGWVLRRFTEGIPDPQTGDTSGTTWQPPIGEIPLIVVHTVVVLAFAVWIGLLARSAAERDDLPAEGDDTAAVPPAGARGTDAARA